MKPNWIALDPQLQMIYNLLTLSTIPVGCVPPIAPPRPFNRFAWPLAIPFPTGVVPRPLSVPRTTAQIIAAQSATVQIAHHQLATATAAPPLTLNLSSTQILAALSPPAQLAAIRVTVLETTCVRQYVRNRLQFAQSRADEIAGRGFASSEVNEARSEEVPKIRPRNVLRSTTQDTLHSFGITPEKDLPSFDTLTGPWSCPGSSDTESSISWVPKRELGNGVNARAILWLKKDGDESSTWVSQQPNTPIIIITTLQRVVTKNLDFAEHWTNRTY